MGLESRSGKVDVANSSKYAIAILAGFLLWKLVALVLGNQPNTLHAVRSMVGQRA